MCRVSISPFWRAGNPEPDILRAKFSPMSMNKFLGWLFCLSCAMTAARALELYPVSFTLHAPDANAVAVTGEFNDWSTNALMMKKSAAGDWWVNARLPAGVYGYKFVKDGKWIFDPAQPKRKFVGQLENSRLIVPVEEQWMLASAAGGKISGAPAGEPAATSAQPRKPVAPWDAVAYKQIAMQYNEAMSSYQQFLQTRANPATLKTIEDSLRDCVAAIEKCKDSAPAGVNTDALLTECNRLIFDIHMTMQARR